MGLIFFVAGLALLALPGACARRGRSLEPSGWARASIASLAGGWLLIEATALLYSAPSVVTFLGGAHADAFCRRMIEQFSPGGPIAVIASGVVALWLPLGAISIVRSMRRTRRSIVAEARHLAHSTHAGYDVVTLPSAEPIACSVRSDATNILISTAVADRLSADQLALVLDHEAAHLDHHHQAYLTISGIIDHTLGRIPFVHTSTTEVGLAIERWADEAASGAPGHRRRALRAAIVTVAATMAAPGVAGLSSLDTVAERLAALDRPSTRPSPRARLVAYLPAILTLLGVVAATYVCRTQILMMLALIGHCAN